MDYIQGTSRDPMILFPEAVDDYIGEENPVRFIDAFVVSLDLRDLGFRSAVLKDTGRPPYNPEDLLKLYLYGYMNSIRSSRRLEKEATKNVEVMWLLGKLVPDFKTIADFRKDNTEALRQICREFTIICREEGLFGGELIAIDGSKFKAVNGKMRNFSREKLKKYLERIDNNIDEYLKQLDEEDAKECHVPKPTSEELKEKIERWKERKKLYKSYQKKLEDEDLSQVSLTDLESRSMPTGGVGTEIAYNVQTAVDAKHHMIVAHDVVNEVTDQNQLAKMALEAKKTLKVKGLKVVVDQGYYDGGEVKKCEDRGIMVYASKPETSANKKLGLFSKEAFVYDKKKDIYICLAKESLTYRFDTVERNRHIKYYIMRLVLVRNAP